MRTMSATDFKARCLNVLDEVREGQGEVVITKRGKPVARLVPVRPVVRTLRGAWKGKGKIIGDIVNTDWSHLFDVYKR